MNTRLEKLSVNPPAVRHDDGTSTHVLMWAWFLCGVIRTNPKVDQDRLANTILNGSSGVVWC